MSDIVINYFTGNNGFFLPDLAPIPEKLDKSKLIFIESNLKIVTWIHSLINTNYEFLKYKDIKLFYYNLTDPTVVYRLLDLDPDEIYFFMKSSGLLFTKKLFKEKDLKIDIQSNLYVADNIHRLIQILKDTKFNCYFPSDVFIKRSNEIKNKELLGMYFAEKFHLLHGKNFENVNLQTHDIFSFNTDKNKFKYINYESFYNF